MNLDELKNILEVLFFISDKPVTLEKLKEIFSEEKDVTEDKIKEAISKISEEYSTRPVELREIAGGYQFATRPQYSIWVKKLFKEKTTLRLTSSAIETLSIIAYKQPITRAEIEEIRGVEVISVLETLLERKLIKIVGRKETVGRPLLYGTTEEFLRYFGLKSLSELPPLDELVPAEGIKSEIDTET